MSLTPIWIKICANTSLEDAMMAAEAGADAVGFVFAPSPRRVTAAQVAAIVPHLPATIEKTGVFVDATLEEIVSTVEACGLTGVQLHFDAASELTAQLHERLGPELRILRVCCISTLAMASSKQLEWPNMFGTCMWTRCWWTLGTKLAVGGTGVTFDWVEARKALFQNEEGRKRLIAAGGLEPR
jgi:phosphoribosylanthranilate isomerase